MAASQEFEDFLIVEDIDLSDESELRRIVGLVEQIVGIPGQGLHISVLTLEQWQGRIAKLPAAIRKGAHHMHALRDTKNPQHLLFSPSAAMGVNDGSRVMIQEVVYATLRCLPSELTGPLKKGVDDIIADICREEHNLDIFTKNYPREATLARDLASILHSQFGYQEKDWLLLLRRDPNRFFLALRKTPFAAIWLSETRKDPKLKKELDEHTQKKEGLTQMLRDPSLSSGKPFFKLTSRVITEYKTKEAK